MERETALNFAQYIKRMRLALNNPSISDERLVNAVIENEVNAAELTKRGSDDYYEIDKGRVSRILNNKDDVPTVLREALQIVNIQNNIINYYEDFVADYLNQYQCPILVEQYASLLQEDKEISEQERNKIMNYRKEPHVFLALLYIAVIKVNNKIDGIYLFRNGQKYVKSLIDDIFNYGFSSKNKKSRILVIPVNTSFETELSTDAEREIDPKVSVDTVHGKWLLRMKERHRNVSEINNRIRENLMLQQIDLEMIKEAPIGTVAVIKEDNTIFYLLAISRFDMHNTASSNVSDIETAIHSLFEFYNRNGQGYTIYIPLVGTGLSRTGLSLQLSYDMITEEALKLVKSKQGKVNIVIRPDDADFVDLRKESNGLQE